MFGSLEKVYYLIIKQHLHPFGCIIRHFEQLGKTFATNTGLFSKKISEFK